MGIAEEIAERYAVDELVAKDAIFRLLDFWDVDPPALVDSVTRWINEHGEEPSDPPAEVPADAQS